MEICRLCLLNNNHYINIFGDFEPNKNVAEIIGKHVGEVNIEYMIYEFCEQILMNFKKK